MKRKTRSGFVNVESQVRLNRSKIGFDEPSNETAQMTVGEITSSLDELIITYEKLAGIDDDFEFDDAHNKFVESQFRIIEIVSPILDRLANVGAFLMEYGFTPDSNEVKASLSLWSETGYQVVAGYRILGTKLDSISDPPPPMVSELDGEDGFLVKE